VTGLELLGYAASLVMGLALGLTGGGGSILTIPILVYLFGVGAVQATTYSLGLVGLVALWGAWGAFRSGELHLSRALFFGIPGVLGVIASRRLLLPMLPAEVSFLGLSLSQNSILLIAFSILMLLASASMIKSSLKNEMVAAISTLDKSVSNTALLLTGLAVGLLAGFVGAGGGFLIVPALVGIGKLDMKQAVGTSLFVIALQSLLGVLGDFKSLAQMDFTLFSVMAVLAVAGMSVGGMFRKHISQSKLKLGFGVFVLVMGSLILFQEFRKGMI
jgi:uncharacterized membrane protein YfcA